MRRLAPIAFLLAFGSPIFAHAQTREDLARADALFNAAKALTDAGQYGDACAKFAESKRLAPGLGVTLYLADCYERINLIASAWTEFRSAEGLARARNDKRAEVARSRAQALEPKLNRITIAVAPTIPRSGLQILRDGVPLGREEFGLAVPVDPGDHVVVVMSPGHPTRTLPAHVGPDKQTAIVRIDSLSEVPETPPPIPAPPVPVASALAALPPPAQPLPEPIAPQADNGKTSRWIGVGVGGLGIVGVGLGATFGILAKSKLDQSNNGPCDASDRCTSSGQQMRKTAEGDATASTFAFVIGGLAVAAGVVIYVTAPRHAAESAIVIAPAPVPGGGGAMLRATF